MPMRLLPPFAALALLAACQSAREAAGFIQRAADQGIAVSVGDPAPAPDPATLGKDGRPLPGGLVGDTANRAYSDVPTPPR